MEPPQPASEPYSIGDSVSVYVAEEDTDAEYHDTECVVIDRFTDELDTETGRKTDGYTYRLESADTKETLPVDFRHDDLVPTQQVNE